MKSFSILCSYVAGLAFVISGFLKLLDPIGTGFIMEEYFKFLHLGFLSGVSVAAGIVMSALEFILGGLMIVRFKMAFTSVAVLVLMGFYLILTLLLAVFNPPMDCGCFGEAVHLTHLQTLIKNTVLSLICLPPFFKRRSIEYTCRKWHLYYRLALIALPVFAVPALSLSYRPFVDFTDFKPSSVIDDGYSGEADYSAAMSFIYEKNGERSVFTLDNLPDSTWTYVETVTAPVASSSEEGTLFALRDLSGEYVSSLFDDERNMIISVHRPGAFSGEDWERVSRFADRLSACGFSVSIAVAADDAELAELSAVLHVPVYSGDYKTLITLNRSNGGFTYIANMSYPTVVEKWAYPMMDRVDPAEIADEDPDVMLMHATIRRGSFMRIVAFAYLLLIVI